jgi:hypothetical protein
MCHLHILQLKEYIDDTEDFVNIQLVTPSQNIHLWIVSKLRNDFYGYNILINIWCRYVNC